jgi:hypothetical protein
MKSTIKIEMDFEEKKPVIEIKNISSEDTRDSLVSYFTQSFQGSGSAKIKFHYLNEDDPINRIKCMRIWPMNESQEKGHAIELIWPTIEDWLEDYKAILLQMDGKWEDNFASINADDYVIYYVKGFTPRQAYLEECQSS